MLCFDQPHLAPRALQGLLAQTYRNLVIRVFDNSTSPEMALALRPAIDRDQRATYFQNGRNIGAYLNAVQALEWAAGAGDYVAIASDHDFVEPDWAERLIAELESDGRCVTAFSDVRREDEQGRSLPGVAMPSVVHRSPTRRAREVLAARGVGNAYYGIHRARIFSRVALRRAITSDLLFMVEMARHGTIRRVDAPLYIRIDQRERVEAVDLISRQYDRLGFRRTVLAPYWLRNAALLLMGGFPPRRSTSPVFAVVAASLYVKRALLFETKTARRDLRRALRRVRGWLLRRVGRVRDGSGRASG